MQGLIYDQVHELVYGRSVPGSMARSRVETMTESVPDSMAGLELELEIFCD